MIDLSTIAKDKALTELFLQNFIMTESDILIAIVGILTYSEQKLLNRIKSDLKKEKNIIVYMLYIIFKHMLKENKLKNILKKLC